MTESIATGHPAEQFLGMRWSFPFEAGALVRGSAVFALRAYAMRLGLYFDCAEDRGWLNSVYMVTVYGSPDAIRSYQQIVARMASE